MPKKLSDGHALMTAETRALKPHPEKKHPKKHVKKHPDEKHPGDHENIHDDLGRAYCHLGRAASISAELEVAPREFVAHFLEYGCQFYIAALAAKGKEAKQAGFAAAEVLRAAEHIAVAGLYARNRKAVPSVPPPKTDTRREVKQVGRKIDEAVRDAHSSPHLVRFTAAARELLNHAEEAADVHEVQLAHEFLHAAEALARALPRLPA